MIEIVAEGVPAGLGAPIYGKLDADIAAAFMSINAVKGVEIGDGFASASLTGPENADALFMRNGTQEFGSNHAGGVLGGISSGQPVVARFAVKPTSSMLTPVPSITRDGVETQVITKGRHDPCVGIRAVPVGEAMMACVLADHLLRHRGQVGANASYPIRVASSVMGALKSLETGQPSLALLASSANCCCVALGTLALRVRAMDVISKPHPFCSG